MSIDRFRIRVWNKVAKQLYEPPLASLEYYTKEMADSFVLMQCTGLKDSEGNSIWEGDVLHHVYCDMTDGEGNALGFDYVVIWKDYTACFALKQILTGNEMEIIMDYKDLSGHTEKVTVLGNIYEHPELLEAGR